MLCFFLTVGSVAATESEQAVDTEPMAELPSGAAELMPTDDPAAELDFGDTLWTILRKGIEKTDLGAGIRLCACLLGVVVLCSLVRMMPQKGSELSIVLVGLLGLCALFTGSFRTMTGLAENTMDELSRYSGLMLPVMASAAAMSGGFTASTALYGGAVIFSRLLLGLIRKLLIPGVYFYLAIALAEAALTNDMLSELREFTGWLISRSMKLLMTVFLAYMSITGIISGSADAAAMKATKAAVSGMIPVVGSILSGASETIVAGAMVIKNSAGIFGMLVVLATCILPFLQVGSQYLLLKLTTAVSGTVGLKPHVNLLKQFSTAMGYLLGMCGSCCMLLLISSICFLKVVVT